MTTTNGAPREHQLFREHRIALGVAFGFVALAVVVFVLLAMDSTKDWVQSVDDAVRDGAQASQWGPLTVITSHCSRFPATEESGPSEHPRM